jgi:pyrimidine-nucleoside phosphorylase
MRMYDLIMKKRNALTLSKEEIDYIISGYVAGDIPDYQMAAFLMAVYFRGMDKEETAAMTLATAQSGDMVDLSSIEGVKVDKHSTGGVGDKTTLIVAPIVAACGCKVAKMSGRGLGHTGGTVDKLESIPNLRTAFSKEEFFDIVRKTGIAVVGQSGNLAPADKKLYALRDVTATVDNISLIAVSIMSKKLAAGSDCIVLDVKCGSGAFMKTLEDAIKLAEEMVDIGEHAGRKTLAVITDMDIPLGNNIGNSLEVIEAVEVLKNKGPKDLLEVSKELAANMLHLGLGKELKECFSMVEEVISSGKALDKLIEMVAAQGGETEVIKNNEKFKKPKFSFELKSDRKGYISHMDTETIGIASSLLGAGRKTKEDSIDYSAGIKLIKKTGDYVNPSDVLCIMYADNEDLFAEAAKKFLSGLEFSDEKVNVGPLVLAKVSKQGVERY